MASRPWRITQVTLILTAVIWIWTLAYALFLLRWNSFERPGPPIKTLFPYGEMRIGVDASYPPFAVATADDLFGLDIDLGRAIGNHIGVPVRFVNMGFDGLYDSLRADQVDVIISALLIDPTRFGDVLYTNPYFNAGLVLVTDEHSDIYSMSDLSGQALAYEFGSQADLEARLWLRRIPPFETRPYEVPHDALTAVRLNEANAALVDATSARLYLREHSDWAAKYLQVSDALYAVAVRLDRGQTWEAINRSIEALFEDGTIQILLQKWL